MKISKKVIFIIVLVIAILTGAFFLLKKTALPVSFLRSSPIDGATGVTLFDPVTLEFNSLTPDLQSKVTYKLDPNNKTDFSWNSSKILTITPSPKFDLGTKFTLSIYYQTTLIKTISFTTKSASELTPQEEQSAQTVDDLLYAQQQEQQLIDRPWSKKLPIDNAQYEAVDDPTNNSIFVRIRDKTTNINTLENQIKAKLISIGVPKNYNIEWVLP